MVEASPPKDWSLRCPPPRKPRCRGIEGQDVTVMTAIKTGAGEGTRGEIRATLDLVHAGPTAVTIRYELTGPEGAPLIIVAGGISAGRHALANKADRADGWWQCQSATFRSCRLLSIDWLGADGDLDFPIDPSDQARALLATLDELGLPRAAAFAGAILGRCIELLVNRSFSFFDPAAIWVQFAVPIATTLVVVCAGLVPIVRLTRLDPVRVVRSGS